MAYNSHATEWLFGSNAVNNSKKIIRFVNGGFWIWCQERPHAVTNNYTTTVNLYYSTNGNDPDNRGSYTKLTLREVYNSSLNGPWREMVSDIIPLPAGTTKVKLRGYISGSSDGQTAYYDGWTDVISRNVSDEPNKRGDNRLVSVTNDSIQTYYGIDGKLSMYFVDKGTETETKLFDIPPQNRDTITFTKSAIGIFKFIRTYQDGSTETHYIRIGNKQSGVVIPPNCIIAGTNITLKNPNIEDENWTTTGHCEYAVNGNTFNNYNNSFNINVGDYIKIRCYSLHTITYAGSSKTPKALSEELTIQPAIELVPPTFTVNKSTDTVTINNPNTIGTIKYKTANTWNTYSSAITLSEGIHIIAKVVYNDDESNEAEFNFTYKSLLPPTISIEDRNVTITNRNTTGTIRYTIDGTDPTISSTIYSNCFVVNNGTIIKAWIVDGKYTSPVSVKTCINGGSSNAAIYVEEYGSENVELQSNVPNSYIDVIFTDNYEVPKTINSINYILNEITSKFTVINPAEESLNRRFSGNKLLVYSDECSSGEINIDIHKKENRNETTDVNGVSINRPADFVFPQWDKGVWLFNYLRNIRNHKLPNNADSFQTKIANNRIYGLSDEASLIFGKYFVIRFVFNNRIKYKLESVDVNISKY